VTRGLVHRVVLLRGGGNFRNWGLVAQWEVPRPLGTCCHKVGFFFFFPELAFELRAVHLQGRCPTM
jgi:hypothetical protein